MKTKISETISTTTGEDRAPVQHEAAAVFAGEGLLSIAVEYRAGLQTRYLALDEFKKTKPDAAGNVTASMPLHLWTAIAQCAEDGVRVGQGPGRSRLPAEVIQAREAALQGAPALLAKFREEEKAEGGPDWKDRAKRRAATKIQQLMKDHGDPNPPAVDTIMGWNCWNS
jgi:hypothetical protein